MVLTIKISRLWAAVLGIVLTMLSIPADALNGNINVSSCACTTTADFVTAAKQQARSLQEPGTYLISSTSNASTAYISVTGYYKNPQDPVWVMTGATPIDANGNSLAGLSEGAQEAIYSAIDTNTMGVSRNFPIALGPIQPGQTQSAIPDYFTSSDDNIWQGVVADSIHNNTSLLVDIELGDTITITWQYTLRGTITAIFQVIKDNKTGYLTLQWRSAEKNGKPINRDGSAAKGNPNTSGSGSGGDRVGGFGPNGSRYDLQTDAGNICASTTSIAIDGITVGYWAGIVPC